MHPKLIFVLGVSWKSRFVFLNIWSTQDHVLKRLSGLGARPRHLRPGQGSDRVVCADCACGRSLVVPPLGGQPLPSSSSGLPVTATPFLKHPDACTLGPWDRPLQGWPFPRELCAFHRHPLSRRLTHPSARQPRVVPAPWSAKPP